MIIDPVTITATATAITTVIFSKAIEKSGENLGDVVSDKIGQLLHFIREKFKAEGIEGKLNKTQEEPSEKNKSRFEHELAQQMEDDDDFAKKLIELKEQLEKLEGSRKLMASGLKLSGDLKAKDMKQKGGEHLEMITNVEAQNIDVGNLTQE